MILSKAVATTLLHGMLEAPGVLNRARVIGRKVGAPSPYSLGPRLATEVRKMVHPTVVLANAERLRLTARNLLPGLELSDLHAIGATLRAEIEDRAVTQWHALGLADLEEAAVTRGSAELLGLVFAIVRDTVDVRVVDQGVVEVRLDLSYGVDWRVIDDKRASTLPDALKVGE